MKYKIINNNVTHNYGEEILHSRGIDNIPLFLNADKSCLQDFNDLENIQLGCKMVEKTYKSDKPYAIIADSDCDGACSFAMLYQYLKCLNPEKQIDYYIHDGKQHGLEDMMDTLQDIEYDIIFCPDSASNDGQYAAQLNSCVMALDHHIFEETSTIPPNMIIINNQTSPAYKNKNLCGAGVTWQFCRALDDLFGVSYAYEYIDLAALATIGDMMSILEYENQYIIQYGLTHIRNFFFKSLIEKQDFSMGSKVNPTTVAFYIVPLINAMIRVGSMDEKYRMFTAFIDGARMVECHKRGAKGTLEKLAIESVRECTNAKAHQDREKERITERLEAKIFKEDLLENKVLFIRLDEEDNFPSVLNGLIAMQISAKYSRPTIVARLNDQNFIRGSARCPGQTELKSFKQYLTSTGLFEYAQGHDFAFGLSIPNNKLSAFHELANEELKDIDFGENCYDVNFERHATAFDLSDMILDLAQYENYYGQQNPEALIAITNLYAKPRDFQIMGKNKDTIKIKQNGIEYIKFHAKDLIEKINSYSDMVITIIGRPSINTWGGHDTPQIMIKDIEIQDKTLAF